MANVNPTTNGLIISGNNYSDTFSAEDVPIFTMVDAYKSDGGLSRRTTIEVNKTKRGVVYMLYREQSVTNSRHTKHHYVLFLFKSFDSCYQTMTALWDGAVEDIADDAVRTQSSAWYSKGDLCMTTTKLPSKETLLNDGVFDGAVYTEDERILIYEGHPFGCVDVRWIAYRNPQVKNNPFFKAEVGDYMT